MNRKILISCLCSAAFLSNTGYANDKVESTYVPATYQKVCQGKAQGDAVSFAYKGIIWNGNCESQFFPATSKGLTGNEPELATACAKDNTIKYAMINRTVVKGKCALSYVAPTPAITPQS